MNIYYLLVWYAVLFAAGRLVMEIVYRAELDGGHLRTNFQGREIPASLGVGFVLLAVAAAPAARLAWPAEVEAREALGLLALCCGFGLLGLLDDMVRTRERGGFSGHLKRLIKQRRVSTALIKAGFGLVLCFSVVLLSHGGGWGVVIIDSLVVALCANAVNLLDVKPGRAVKGFVGAMALLMGASLMLQFTGGRASVGGAAAVLLVPFALWALASWPYDLGCRAMMGDAGSNVLGAALGLALVWELSPPFRAVSLGLLIVYHLVCEIGSLSAIIQSVPPLRALDNFGVKLLAKVEEGAGQEENGGQCEL